MAKQGVHYCNYDRCSCRKMGDYKLTASESVRFLQDLLYQWFEWVVVMMELWALVPRLTDFYDMVI